MSIVCQLLLSLKMDHESSSQERSLEPFTKKILGGYRVGGLHLHICIEIMILYHNSHTCILNIPSSEEILSVS